MKTELFHLSEASQWNSCVLTYGHFSTIHPGHIRYLRHARSLGGQLVVALIGDESGSFPFNQLERAEALSLLRLADGVLLLRGDELNDAIQHLKPTDLVLGNEYRQKQDIQSSLTLQRSLGGSLHFDAGEVHYASTELLSSSESDLQSMRNKQFAAACKRQGLDEQQILHSMQNWSSTRLIVLGDTIVDQYAACEAIGMSAEAPVIVVRELGQRNFIGGAAIVAAHIRAIGAQCDLVSVVGNDSSAHLVKQELADQQIGDALTTDPTRPTTFKKRYLVDNQKLFRVSRLEEQNLDTSVEAQLIEQLEALAPKAKGIVVSDFVYGVVTPKILGTVQQLALKHNLTLFGDLQCSSQLGSVTRFQHFSLLCPNEREARLALQDKESGLEHISQQLIQQTHCKRLLMKLGSEGFIAYDLGHNKEINSQAFPALSVNPLDVTGAGDSLLAAMATGLASGQAMMPTAALACCMSSLAVKNMGNKPISADSLRSCVQKVLKQQ